MAALERQIGLLGVRYSGVRRGSGISTPPGLAVASQGTRLPSEANQRFWRHERATVANIQGDKMCQNKCKALTCKSTNTLQRRLRRFESDASLQSRE